MIALAAMSTQKNVVFILVRSEYPGNIGAAARALKNFGFSELRLVEPCHDYLEKDDRWMAVEAYDLIERAQLFPTLEAALEDVNIAAATSSARLRETPSICAEEAMPQLVNNSAVSKVAFVFGNERQGLTKAELERCHLTVNVPTNPDFSVMNLAQAVCVIAYEFSRKAMSTNARTADQELTTGRDDDLFFLQVEKLFNDLSFTREHNHELIMSTMRSMYQRSHVTARELSLLKGVLHRISLKLHAPRSEA